MPRAAYLNGHFDPKTTAAAIASDATRLTTTKLRKIIREAFRKCTVSVHASVHANLIRGVNERNALMREARLQQTEQRARLEAAVGSFQADRRAFAAEREQLLAEREQLLDEREELLDQREQLLDQREQLLAENAQLRQDNGRLRAGAEQQARRRLAELHDAAVVFPCEPALWPRRYRGDEE